MRLPANKKSVFVNSSKKPSCLAKIFGAFNIHIKSNSTKKEIQLSFIIMEDIFFGKDVSKTYDLKGIILFRGCPIVSIYCKLISPELVKVYEYSIVQPAWLAKFTIH